MRNDYFDANDFFSDRAQATSPEHNQNQFGASLGGPIKKDRLFCFFDYEGTRIKQGCCASPPCRCDNERIGDFSNAAAAAAGRPRYHTDLRPDHLPQPVHRQRRLPAVPQQSGSLPAAIDSSVAALMALFPEPNYNRLAQPSRAEQLLSHCARHRLRRQLRRARRLDASSTDTVFARYNYFNRTRDIPGYFGGFADGTSTSAWGNQILKAHSVVLGWTHIINRTDGQ